MAILLRKNKLSCLVFNEEDNHTYNKNTLNNTEFDITPKVQPPFSSFHAISNGASDNFHSGFEWCGPLVEIVARFAMRVNAR